MLGSLTKPGRDVKFYLGAKPDTANCIYCPTRSYGIGGYLVIPTAARADGLVRPYEGEIGRNIARFWIGHDNDGFLVRLEEDKEGRVICLLPVEPEAAQFVMFLEPVPPLGWHKEYD